MLQLITCLILLFIAVMNNKTKSKLGRENYMAYKSSLELIILGNSKQEVDATNSLKSKSRERK